MEKNSLTIPVAIVLAGALIAGAVIFSNNKPGNIVAGTGAQNPTAAVVAHEINLNTIDSSDHILGNPDAKALLVEYSDTECPFCKNLHTTLNQLSEEYGKDGKFAWVYRHFPLDQLHKKARHEAEATECAAELGGNTKFWEYTNRLYEVTGSNDRLDPAELPKIAVEVGLNKAAFEACLSSGKHAAEVEKDVQDAVKAGGQGTPYSVFVLKDAPSKELKDFVAANNPQVIGFSKDERKLFVSGAHPIQTWKTIIEILNK